jgi:hypothetical protein
MGVDGALRVNAPLWVLALAFATPAVAVPGHYGALTLVAHPACEPQSPGMIPRCLVIDGNELYRCWKCTSCMHGHPASGALWANSKTHWLSVYEIMVSNSSLLTNAFSPFGKTIGLLRLWL